MMCGKKLFFIFILALVGFALGLDNQAAGQEKQSYASLLARVKEFDRSVDFKALRLSYTETAEYEPYSKNVEIRKAMFEAFGEKQYDKALQHAQLILDKEFVDIDAHHISRLIYREMGNLKQQDFHHFVTKGLIDSILDSGDGKSPETAYQVISVREEYIILSVLGLKLEKQGLMGSKGHSYDKMEVKNPRTQETVIIYFNVDLPLGSLNKKLK